MRNVITDRFVWFLIFGAGLFALHAYLSNPASKVRVEAADMAMLAHRWEAQTGNAPSPDEMISLVEYHVREEILAREARRLGLDADDAILRRRLVQKMELLIRDRYEPQAASDAALKSYFSQNETSYATPKRAGFRHVFLGPEDEVAPDQLAQIRSSLAAPTSPEAWRSMGRPFMLARQFGPLNELDLTELFGRDFAESILANDKAGDWIGPVQSAYGLHLVQILSVSPAQTPAFDDVHDQVVSDFREAQIKAHEAEAWRDIRARYQVKIAAPHT